MIPGTDDRAALQWILRRERILHALNQIGHHAARVTWDWPR